MLLAITAKNVRRNAKSKAMTACETPCVDQLASSCGDLTPTGGRTGLL